MEQTPGRSPAVEHLWIEEAGSGPQVLLIHGLGGTSTYYEPLTLSLAESHHVIRFDLAGHGRSALAGTPSIESWANDALSVLDLFGIGRASVIGHSVGTLIVQHLAAAHPDRVSQIILLGPVRPQSEDAKNATRQRAAVVRANGMRAVADTIVEAAVSDHVWRNNPEVVGFVRELLLGQDPEGYALACEALAAAQGTDPTAIRADALLVTGRDDNVSPPAAVRELGSALPRARVEVLENCGHWTALERHVEVARLAHELLSTATR